MLFLVTQIFLWLAIAFALGAIIGWWYGSSSAIDNMQAGYDFKKATENGGGSIGVLSDSLMKTQNELAECQQSLALAETKLKDMDMRYSKEKGKSGINKESQTLILDASLDHGIQAPGEASIKDDLTKIHGIGPYIERKLNEMEIYTYNQIAELTDDEIEIIGQSINYFPTRIHRDNWIESARKLHNKKYNQSGV